ncbi:hypothetical protein H0E84_18080 [Luteimonas sp. SJ-92]|uniref:Uncharacterized protein n=1 Tax=Luteimonas salinisoli TaxID=2752307 RepID=A0A853JIC4_9GAMM|nr:hypothetical protein [Luteimonas salinisoli]NZA28287.1 hypothetical protein [Luteimonas salinisoli]
MIPAARDAIVGPSANQGNRSVKRLVFCSSLMLSLAFGSVSLAQSTADADDEETAAMEMAGDQVAEYLAEVREILSLAERGEYGRFRARDRDALRNNGNRIIDLLTDRSGTDELSLHQKTELFNAQKSFEAIVQHQRENAVVCRQVAKTGTRITSTQCASVATIERERRNARETADQIIRQPSCVSHFGGGEAMEGGSC